MTTSYLRPSRLSKKQGDPERLQNATSLEKSMKSTVSEYLGLLKEQELRRLLAGGELGQDVELAFAMKMEPLWEKMTSEERALVEKALS